MKISITQFTRTTVLTVLLAIVALTGLATPEPAFARAAAQASTEMRHFWHVFVAYAAAWILLFGWVVAILRRLKRVERDLGTDDVR